MVRSKIKPTNNEITFNKDDIIVSKTDTRGIITYANQVFQDVSGYKEDELLGLPHNILRHPDMPACVFKLLWNTIEEGKEIFAYVKNLAKNGGYYWVFAHVTPSFDVSGHISGYHSNRRVPYPDALQKVIPLYKKLREIESRHGDTKEGMNAAFEHLRSLLQDQGASYEEFVFQLSEQTQLSNAIH